MLIKQIYLEIKQTVTNQNNFNLRIRIMSNHLKAIDKFAEIDSTT